MADRLQELLQQRALIKEHLAWIEGEISAAAGQPNATSSSPTREVPPAPSPLPPTRASAMKAPLASVETGPRLREEEDVLIARLAADEKTTPAPTKWGCWIFFWTILIAVAAAAWAMLHFFYRD